VLSVLRWLLPAVVPAVLLAVVVYRTDREREPPWLVITVFVLAAALAGVSLVIERRVVAWTGLDVRAAVVGEAGALIYVFALVAPLREALKVAAVWPAFRSRHFDEPYDGIVYASAAALGFASTENAYMLHAHPQGGVWLARAVVALPAHLFFACLWGYALGRAKQPKVPGGIFPLAWFVAAAAHGLYAHFVYGRGPGALVAVVPLLVPMGAVAWFAARDLKARGERPSREFGIAGSSRLSRPSMGPISMGPTTRRPPSLRTVREALRRADQPILLRWIVFGAVVTLGAMVSGLGLSIGLGLWAHIDFSVVDEHDVTTTAPLALLAAGLLAGFPVSGFLVARASRLPTLLEPALATGLAILATLVVLGFTAPVALVFALAFSPIAFGLACAGAWVGRPAQ
jgi:RsiW-degrading membrane proteinase PrsW (M82 family)